MNRKELKEKAKAALKANYIRCVVVSLILVAVTGASLTLSFNTSGVSTANGSLEIEVNGEQVDLVEAVQNDETVAIILTAIAVIVLLAVLLAVLADVFAANPLEVGCKDFFLDNSKEEAKMDRVINGFKNGYKRNVWAMFLKGLYVFLWSCLLIVPGIIKSIAYSMVPYILADEPYITAKEALKKSQAMTKGHKGELFMLDLSFFGWFFLTALTFGVLGVFYVNPYYNGTQAEAYRALKDAYEEA